MAIEVAKVELKTVQDASGLEQRIAEGAFTADQVIAVIGKTEGNGGVNDFTREYAVAALCDCLAPHLGLAAREVEARVLSMADEIGAKQGMDRRRFFQTAAGMAA